MKQPTKQQLFERAEQYSRENCVMSWAMNALVNGECHRIGKSHHYTVQTCGEDAAHGGIAIVTFSPPGQRPYTTAHYFDEWFDYWRDYNPVQNDTETLAVRELAYAAKRYVVAQQSKLTEAA